MNFLKSIGQSKMSLYCTLFALLMIGDGIMSYFLPVAIEESVGNQLLMGIILAFSSVVGLFCDFVFSRLFRGKSFSVIIRKSLAAAITFPIVVLVFGRQPWVFLIAMAIWGIYYELAMFSNYHFIDETIPTEEQPLMWGFMGSIWSIAWFVAPIMAALAHDYFANGPLFLALVFYLLGLITFLGVKNKFKVIKKEAPKSLTETSAKQELSVWLILFKKLWPVYLLNLMAILLMAGFWSVGALLAEELSDGSKLGMLFFSAWTAPPLIFSAFSGPITKRFRKKRTAFAAALLSGLFLLPLIWIHSVLAIIIFTFMSSVCYAIGYPGLDAAIQEYIKRLGPVGNDLVGLQSSAASFAYIFGPIIAGFLASFFGNQAALGALGAMFAIAGIVGLIFVRHEIRLPYEALHKALPEQKF